jgi:protein-L-isoaspartate(D-aspartate) O-methyltransferase
MPDFATRRTVMVDTQIRPSDVTKFPVIEAMLAIPREHFLPADLAEAAYAGTNVALPGGRVLLEPRTLAKALDALDLQRGDLVLDLAVGTGYSSAVLAHMVETVIAIETDAGDAQSALSEAGADNAVAISGDPRLGAAAHGPYDAMMVQGGIETFPAALADQLKTGGRVTALFMQGHVGVMRLGIKQGGQIIWRDIFNAAAPVLPEFARTPAFTF